MEEQLRLLFQITEHIETPVVIAKSTEFDIIKLNKSFASLIEIENKPDPMISFDSFLSRPQDLKSVREVIQKARKTKSKEQLSGVHFKGLVNTFSLDFEPIQIDGKVFFVLIKFTIEKDEMPSVKADITRKFLENSQSTAKIGSWKYDFNTNESTWSKGVTEILGVPENYRAHLELALDFYKPGVSREKAENAIRLAEQEGQDFDIECIIVDSEKNEKWVRVTGKSHKNSIENYVIGTFQDITRRKKAESKVNKRNQFIENILENLPIGIATNNIDTNETQFINQKFFEIYGWNAEELDSVDRFFEKVYPDPEYRNQIMTRVMADIQSGDPERMQWSGMEITTKSGKKKIIEAKNIPVYDHNLMISTVSDITKSYRAEQELLKTKNRLYYATKASSDAIWDWYINEDKIFWSEGYYRLFGYKTDDNYVTKAFWKSKIHPNDYKSFFESLNQAITDPDLHKWTFDYRFLKSDESYSYVRENVIFIRDESGKVYRLVGAIQDISSSRKREHHLNLLESVIANTKDSILVTKVEEGKQLDNTVIFANQSFADLSGYSVQEIIGKKVMLTYGKRTSKTVIEELEKKLSAWDACNVEMINYTKSGKEFWNSISFTPIADQNGWYTHWVSIQRDITAKKTREHQGELAAFTHRAFHQSKNLNEIFVEILDEIHNIVDFSLAEIWTTNSSQDKLRLFAESYKNPKMTEFYENSADTKKFEKGEGLPGIILKNKKMQFWENISDSEDWIRKSAGKLVDLKDAFGFPIIGDDKILGVLLLGFSHQYNQEQTLRNLFENFPINLGAEIRRKQSEDELNQFFDFAPDFMCIAGKNAYLKKVNTKAAKILGFQEQNLLDKPLFDFIPIADHELIINNFLQLQSGVETVYFESRLLRKSGEELYIAWTISKSDKSSDFYCVGKDISEKIRLEQLLARTNQLAAIGNWEVNLETGKTFWSDVAKTIFNLPDEKQPSIKDTLELLQLQNDLQVLRNKGEKWIEEELQQNFETQITPKGQEPIWVRIISDVECVGGVCNRVFGSVQNINERKTAQLKQLRILEEKNEILESISDGFFAVDKKWKVTYWNAQAEINLRVEKDKIIKKNIWEFFDQDSADVFKKQYLIAFETKKSVHFESYFEPLNSWFEVNAYPSKDILSVYFKDITEQKKNIDKIKSSNEKFRRVSEAINDVIWDLDLESDRIIWSQGLKGLFGYEPEEFGNEIESWSQRLHPEDYDRVLSSFESALNNSKEDFWRADYRFKRKDDTYADVIDRGSIIRNEDNKPIRMVGAIQDISDLKSYQKSLEKLNLELKKRAKALEISNKDLEQFAYVASHDLQEPLRMVTGFLSRLEEKYKTELDEKAQQYIYFAVDGAKRMRQIILDLLEFSRIGRDFGKIKQIDVNEVIQDIRVLLKERVEQTKAEIITGKLPEIICTEGEIRQVLYNLIDNALKYHKKNQSPIINIRCKEKDKHFQFSIEDNGIGIEASYYKKIFTIFKRLHQQNEYSGTGIGLAITKKIIDNLGGKIWLKSDLDVGTTFFFTIPKKI
ncbi:PAS domain S-box protein [Psychroflexus aestuariivivens]|uniref:PAS domain S-box protein n=1 Tax=Psychroflexus aestuariivivens TaxID=1795040 RepID=UPI000FD85625|nr:PAS domain S-box protein [Psychroflexus aestuariivivens]